MARYDLSRPQGAYEGTILPRRSRRATRRTPRLNLGRAARQRTTPPINARSFFSNQDLAATPSGLGGAFQQYAAADPATILGQGGYNNLMNAITTRPAVDQFRSGIEADVDREFGVGQPVQPMGAADRAATLQQGFADLPFWERQQQTAARGLAAGNLAALQGRTSDAGAGMRRTAGQTYGPEQYQGLGASRLFDTAAAPLTPEAAAYAGPKTQFRQREARGARTAEMFRQAAPSEIMTRQDDLIAAPTAPGALGQAYQTPWEAFNQRSQTALGTGRAGEVPTTYGWKGRSGVERGVSPGDQLARGPGLHRTLTGQAVSTGEGRNLPQPYQNLPQWMRQEMVSAKATGRRIPTPTQLRLGQAIAPSAAAIEAGAPAAMGGVDPNTQLAARGAFLGLDPTVQAAQQYGLGGVQRAAQEGRDAFAQARLEREPLSDAAAHQRFVSERIAAGASLPEAMAEATSIQPPPPGSIVGRIPEHVRPEIQRLVDSGEPGARREARAVLQNKTELSKKDIEEIIAARFGPPQKSWGQRLFGFKPLLRPQLATP